MKKFRFLTVFIVLCGLLGSLLAVGSVSAEELCEGGYYDQGIPFCPWTPTPDSQVGEPVTPAPPVDPTPFPTDEPAQSGSRDFDDKWEWGPNGPPEGLVNPNKEAPAEPIVPRRTPPADAGSGDAGSAVDNEPAPAAPASGTANSSSGVAGSAPVSGSSTEPVGQLPVAGAGPSIGTPLWLLVGLMAASVLCVVAAVRRRKA